MATPHPAQRDLLDQLAQRGKPLYQQRLLEPHLALGTAELAAADVRDTNGVLVAVALIRRMAWIGSRVLSARPY